MTKKNKTILIIISLTLLSILIVGLFTTLIRNRITESLINQAAKSDLGLAIQASELIENEIETIQHKLLLVREIPEIQNNDPEACNKKLEEIAPHLQDQINNISRINSNLIVDCALNQETIGFSIPADSEIIDTIKDPAHPPFLSRIAYSTVTQQQTIYLSLPIYTRTGEYYGIIGGVIYLNDLSNKYLEKINLGETGYVTLLDDDGTILYNPNTSIIGTNIIDEIHKTDDQYSSVLHIGETFLQNSQNNKTSNIIYQHIDKDILSVSAPVNVFPERIWTVILTIPTETIISDLRDNLGLGQLNIFIYISSIATLTIILFSAIILFYVIQNLFKPLSEIKMTANEIEKGNLDIKINEKILNSKNEFGELAKTINKMATSLRKTHADLEKQVKERTKNLIERTKELEKTNEFMMGREVRMTELKKEIKQLKEKLGEE